MQNPKLATSILKLLGRIVDTTRNGSYSSFEQVIHKIPRQKFQDCNFSQFFGNSAAETQLIMLVDCYAKKNEKLTGRRTLTDQEKVPNVFSDLKDYEYFL